MNPTADAPPPPAHRGEIAILIATRARPQYIAEVLRSLSANTARKDQVSVWLYADTDDHVTRQAIDSKQIPTIDLPVHWHFGGQTSSLGETHEILWRKSGRTAQIYMISVDDARFDTPGWDEIARGEFDRHPDGILLAFPHDPMTADTATYPIFGYGWLNTLQQIFPGHFPFWFDDCWVSQIGALSGRSVKLPILLYPIRGKGRTKRMRNLPFWTRFFQLTLEERKSSAAKLLDAVRFDDPAQRAAALAEMEKVARELAQQQDNFSDLYNIFQEERHTDLSPEERRVFDGKYFKQEALAVANLIGVAQKHVTAGQFAEAMRFLDATQLSDLRVKQAQHLKAECLRGLNRSPEADKLTSEAMAAWPEMNLLRRLFRFVGWAANDVKRVVVGIATRDKKKPQ